MKPEDSVKIQFARVHCVPECRVCEVHVPVVANHNVVRRVEPLAFPLCGEHLDSALSVRSRDAAGMGLTGVEIALGIEGVAACPAGITAPYCRSGLSLFLCGGRKLNDPVGGYVGKDQEPGFGPNRSFS